MLRTLFTAGTPKSKRKRAHRRSTEEVEVLRQRAPHLARLYRRERRPIRPRHAQRLQRHALRRQHPVHVVIWRDEQRCRVGEAVVRVRKYSLQRNDKDGGASERCALRGA